MRSLFSIFLFILLNTAVNAQVFLGEPKPKFETIVQDTINIRGIIFDLENNPVTNIQLRSRASSSYQGLYTYTSTNLKGEFTLNGALANDTLTCTRKEKNFSIAVNGSRYLEIHLPYSGFAEEPKPAGNITARRTHKKVLATQKIVTNWDVLDWYGVGADMFINAEPFEKYPLYIDKIKSLINYPLNAINKNIEGEVEIGFKVDKAGSLSEFRVIRGIGYGCDEEVIKALSNGPKWRPKIVMGRPMEDQSSVKIDFKLTDK